jgi:PHD/YefM family antitoxin component YafN of YafNO toxin-antitoxin module
VPYTNKKPGTYIRKVLPVALEVNISDFQRYSFQCLGQLEDDGKGSVLQVNRRGEPAFVVMTAETYKQLMRDE